MNSQFYRVSLGVFEVPQWEMSTGASVDRKAIQTEAEIQSSHAKYKIVCGECMRIACFEECLSRL